MNIDRTAIELHIKSEAEKLPKISNVDKTNIRISKTLHNSLNFMYFFAELTVLISLIQIDMSYI